MYAGRRGRVGAGAGGSSTRPRTPTRGRCSSRSRGWATGRERLTAIEGQPPDLAAPPAGCAFHPRCPQVMDRCREEAPPESVAGPATHRALLAVDAAPADGGAMSARTRPRGRRPHQALPGEARALRPRRIGAVRAVDGVLVHRSTRARRWAWSANRAAARPRPPSSCCGWRSPPAGAIRFEGQELQEPRRRRPARSTGASVQAVFQDPFASLNPRMRVGAIIAEPLDHQRVARRRPRSRKRVRAAARPGRAARARRRPLPARVLGRPAPAHRHRARAGALAQAGRARRAGVRARRVDPRADPEPAARPAGPSSACPISSSPTTWPRWRT